MHRLAQFPRLRLKESYLHPRSRGGAIDSVGIAMPPSLRPLWGGLQPAVPICFPVQFNTVDRRRHRVIHIHDSSRKGQFSGPCFHDSWHRKGQTRLDGRRQCCLKPAKKSLV
ncbi:hypothetical protein A2U01_0033760 [Trifolium medium]|uniref:Uncharacterized protein n=1 Tax=Trifolium medium TaxID=97028 RepID=A0A392PLH8_9FABA|nr:hypothetical protein [Trifolium medium]